MDPKTKYKLFKQNENFCVCPWTNVEIFTNGDVKTCSVGKEIIGNVNETDITELLQKSDTLKRIRANMLENRPDPNCTVCQFRTIESNEFTYLKDHYNSAKHKAEVRKRQHIQEYFDSKISINESCIKNCLAMIG